MSRESFYISGGPLHGQSYALDLRDGDEVAFTVDGQAHVYRAKIDWDTGHGPDRFALYVGVDPTIGGGATYR